MINIKKELEHNSTEIIIGSLAVGITSLIIISYLKHSHSKKTPLDNLKHMICNLHDSLQGLDMQKYTPEKKCETSHYESKTRDILELVSLGVNLLNKITKR